MLTEFITITVLPGRRDELLARIGETGPTYLAQPGVHSGRFLSQVDADDVVLGVIDWESKDALDAAVAGPAGQAFLGAIGPLMAEAPDIRLGA